MKKETETNTDMQKCGVYLSVGAGIITSLVFVLIIMTLKHYTNTLDKREGIIVEYIKVDKNASNKFISTKVNQLEDLFETKSNFLREVKIYKHLETSEIYKKMKKELEDNDTIDHAEKEYFLNN